MVKSSRREELITELSSISSEHEWQVICEAVESNRAYMQGLMPRTSDEQREFANAWNDRYTQAHIKETQ